MNDLKFTIPYYREINEFLTSIPSEHVSKNPDFFCLRMHENESSISNYKPPFRKDFYFIALITDAGKTILYCADLCPTSAHIPIPFVMGYDNNPMVTIEEKKRILPVAYEDNWIIVYEHDAFTQASKVISTEKGFTAGEKVIITEM